MSALDLKDEITTIKDIILDNSNNLSTEDYNKLMLHLIRIYNY